MRKTEASSKISISFVATSGFGHLNKVNDTFDGGICGLLQSHVSSLPLNFTSKNKYFSIFVLLFHTESGF